MLGIDSGCPADHKNSKFSQIEILKLGKLKKLENWKKSKYMNLGNQLHYKK